MTAQARTRNFCRATNGHDDHATAGGMAPPAGPMPSSPRQPTLDTVLAAVLYLMSRYASHPDPDLAEAICFHLEILARREDTPEESLGRAARRLWPLWRGVAMDCPAVVRLYQVGGEVCVV